MNPTSSRRRRQARHVAALILAACLLGATACGTETTPDHGSAAAPAPQAQSAVHLPVSADAAERRGASGASERRAAQDALEQYLRHLLSATEKRHQVKLRRTHQLSTRGGRDVPIS